MPVKNKISFFCAKPAIRSCENNLNNFYFRSCYLLLSGIICHIHHTGTLEIGNSRSPD